MQTHLTHGPSGGDGGLLERGALEAGLLKIPTVCFAEARAIGGRCRRKVIEELHLERVAPRVAEVLLGSDAGNGFQLEVASASAARKSSEAELTQ